MKTARGRAFEQYEPTLEDGEIIRAVETERAVVSFKGKPVLNQNGEVGFLAIKIAFHDGATEVLLLDRFGADALLALIEAANQVNWDGNRLKAAGTQH